MPQVIRLDHLLGKGWEVSQFKLFSERYPHRQLGVTDRFHGADPPHQNADG